MWGSAAEANMQAECHSGLALALSTEGTVSTMQGLRESADDGRLLAAGSVTTGEALSRIDTKAKKNREIWISKMSSTEYDIR